MRNAEHVGSLAERSVHHRFHGFRHTPAATTGVVLLAKPIPVAEETAR